MPPIRSSNHKNYVKILVALGVATARRKHVGGFWGSGPDLVLALGGGSAGAFGWSICQAVHYGAHVTLQRRVYFTERPGIQS